jgi:hypothetical protein
MRLRVEYAWINGSSILVPIFLIIWCAVAGFVGYIRFLADEITVPTICLIGIALGLYSAVTLTINKTIIFVSPERIEVSHEPMPWFGEQTLNVCDIQSITWKERSTSDGVSYFKFCFNLADGRCVTIFPVVAVGKPDAALRAVKKVTDWLAPFRRIDITEL